MNLEISGGDL